MKIKNNGLSNKTIIIRTIIIAIILSMISLLMEEPFPFIIGLVFGVVFSILNFRLLDLTIKKSIRMTPAKAQSYITTRYFIRYILVAVVIYVSIDNPTIHVLGTIVGILIIKFVIIGSNVLNKGNNINIKH